MSERPGGAILRFRVAGRNPPTRTQIACRLFMKPEPGGCGGPFVSRKEGPGPRAYGRIRLIRSRSLWNLEIRPAPGTRRVGTGEAAGQGATRARHAIRIPAPGNAEPSPRRNVSPTRASVADVRRPVRGRTATRAKVYANPPMERTVARCPGSNRRFRNAVVIAGW